MDKNTTIARRKSPEKDFRGLPRAEVENLRKSFGRNGLRKCGSDFAEVAEVKSQTIENKTEVRGGGSPTLRVEGRDFRAPSSKSNESVSGGHP